MSEEGYYYKYTFVCKDLEALVARLNELPFNGFEMDDSKVVHAYLDAKNKDETFSSLIDQVAQNIEFSHSIEKIALKNWNETWENDFKPVQVDNFCVVRADFHPKNGETNHEIIITPQMSFGTGHHETTRGMIQMMRDMDFENKKVLDFGCGTGVLAILASKLKAKTILGVDIDNNAYINSIHNCEQNEVHNVLIKQGDLSETEQEYDIILANINRHVILDTLPSLSSKLSIGKPLLISGILHTDVPLVKKHLEMASFNIIKAQQINDWMCILTEKV